MIVPGDSSDALSPRLAEVGVGISIHLREICSLSLSLMVFAQADNASRAKSSAQAKDHAGETTLLAAPPLDAIPKTGNPTMDSK